MSVPPQHSSASAADPETSPPKTTTESKSKSKSKSTSSKQPSQLQRSLDRLLAVDTSRALLNMSMPTRYDPYYRFPNKPPVYAPYNSEIMEELARYGVIDYSLALSEDSRCWRLHELLQDENMMREFMKNGVGWTVRLGPRGQEVEYNVEDIVAARLGVEPRYNSRSSEYPIPDPCNTPRPSTPHGSRDRNFLRATMSWAGMYDDLDEREAAAASSSSRAQSATPSSSNTQDNDAGMTRALSLDTGLSEKITKQPSVVWKTAYEDASSKEELGRQLDEQAAQCKGKAQHTTESGSDEDNDDVYGSVPKTHEEEDTETPRNSVFRFWNDEASDEEDDSTTKNLNPLFQRMGDDDSDDDISEGDIEPDPTSPRMLARPCGDTSGDASDDSNSEGTEEEAEDDEQDQEGGDEEEDEQRDEQGDEDEDEDEEHQGEVEEAEPAIVVEAVNEIKVPEKVEAAAAPFTRPNARNFLQMFYSPAAHPATNGVAVEETQPAPMAKQILGFADHAMTLDENNKRVSSSTPTAARPSSKPESPKEEGDSPSKVTEAAESDHDSDSGVDLQQSSVIHPTPSQREGERLGQDEAIDENNDNGHNGQQEINDNASKGDEVTKEDDDNIQNDHNDIRNDHNETPSLKESQDHRDEEAGEDSDDDIGPELQLDETQPNWDRDLSYRYKEKYPNKKNTIHKLCGPVKLSLDWGLDDLPDEWSEATEWYTGRPDRDPELINWTCPLRHNLNRWTNEQPRRVIQIPEPEGHDSKSEVDADKFYAGLMSMQEHAEYLDKKLQDLERWRKGEYRTDLMINWRVRTGQQTPLCGGWWFIHRDNPWWLLDWSKKGTRYHDDDD